MKHRRQINFSLRTLTVASEMPEKWVVINGRATIYCLPIENATAEFQTHELVCPGDSNFADGAITNATIKGRS